MITSRNVEKEDFDGAIFTVQRTESARVMTDTTKTDDIHEIAMVDAFKPFHKMELQKQKRLGIISPISLSILKGGS